MGRPRTVTLALLAAALVAAACDDDRTGAGQSAPTSSDEADAAEIRVAAARGAPVETASSSAPGTGDGVLKIGVLLPRTGPGTAIGNPGINAVNLAVNQINEAEGVFGEPVQVFTADEGANADSARQGLEELVAEGVDAIIGPASSTVAADLLPDLAALGLVTCSPTASAEFLDHYPNRALFFRTIPSDSLLAHAMAQFTLNTGRQSAQVVYLDDAYGRPLAQVVIDDLRASSVEVVSEIPLAVGGDDLSDEVRQLAENPDSVVVLVADPAHGWALITAMAEHLVAAPPKILINDAMKIPPDGVAIRELPEELRGVIEGLSPPGVPTSRGEPDGAFATHSYNCANLIALAATSAGGDDPASVAEEMITVSVDGTQCHNFAECVGPLNRGFRINYQGPGSFLDLSSRGDPRRGQFAIFAYGETGNHFHRTTMTVTDPDV